MCSSDSSSLGKRMRRHTYFFSSINLITVSFYSLNLPQPVHTELLFPCPIKVVHSVRINSDAVIFHINWKSWHTLSKRIIGVSRIPADIISAPVRRMNKLNLSFTSSCFSLSLLCTCACLPTYVRTDRTTAILCLFLPSPMSSSKRERSEEVQKNRKPGFGAGLEWESGRGYSNLVAPHK